jgi:hypothetical protein
MLVGSRNVENAEYPKGLDLAPPASRLLRPRRLYLVIQGADQPQPGLMHEGEGCKVCPTGS